MSDEEKAKENEVFDQEVSLGDLNAVAGGEVCDVDACYSSDNKPKRDKDVDRNNCINYDFRSIYGGNGFPNCAATVEDGSWCFSNDACYNEAVDYRGLTDCKKAWR